MQTSLLFSYVHWITIHNSCIILWCFQMSSFHSFLCFCSLLYIFKSLNHWSWAFFFYLGYLFSLIFGKSILAALPNPEWCLLHSSSQDRSFGKDSSFLVWVPEHEDSSVMTRTAVVSPWDTPDTVQDFTPRLMDPPSPQCLSIFSSFVILSPTPKPMGTRETCLLSLLKNFLFQICLLLCLF